MYNWKNTNIIKSSRIPFQVKLYGLFKFKNSFFSSLLAVYQRYCDQ